ncbi:MAG: SDR family oxidoreductase [Bacteroidota bacterium]
MDLQIKSKTAFISGSTQGIGFAIAETLLAEGANVIINGRTTLKVEEAVALLKKKFPESSIQGFAADLSVGEQVEDLLKQLPAVEILINNAGMFQLKPFFELTDPDWQQIFEINVLGGIRLTRALMPGMLKKNWGRIVFISSEAGINVPEHMIHYGLTKTALLSLSNGLAKMTRNTHVTVNTIVGGPTYSDGVATAIHHLAEEQQQSVEVIKQHIMNSMNPTSLIGRFIEPSEIASLTGYLCSPAAAAINGASLRVDGGILTGIN